jgi:DNA-binding beta-propeller fold protein YncE
MTHRTALSALAISALVACAAPAPSPAPDETTSTAHRLPTGARLDPAGVSHDVGPFPLATVPAPDGKTLVVLMNGWRDQGIQVVDRATGEVVQTLSLPAVFIGLVFSPDGKSLYVSGGNGDVVYRCDWTGGKATLADSVILAPRVARRSGTRYPAGLAISADGKTLYAAENLADSLAVIDLASGKVVQRFATERYPYGVARAPDGTVYVSAWGGWTVSVFKPGPDGKLEDGGRIPMPRHPSALLLNRDGTRLYVASGSTDRIAVIDTRTRQGVALLKDPPPSDAREGSTPDALALSDDETRLFVAEADNNSVAVFDLSASGKNELAGRIPAGWYPSALLVSGDQLVVLSAKGKGTGPNPRLEQPDKRRTEHTNQYTLGQISGTIGFIPLSELGRDRLATLTERVASANGWNASEDRLRYPPFQHVIYIIKENRTFDQVFGDLPQADGDSSLVFFPRPVSPNHHALAERFGIFDRFFVNAEVSPDGHEWSTAAYVTDYAEKTIPQNYSSRGRSYDYEGENRDTIPSDDVAEAASGYLWDLADRAGISYRNYGEFVHLGFGAKKSAPGSYFGVKPSLQKHTNPNFPGFDTDIPDQHRADVWLEEFRGFEQSGELPALEIMRLPNDHTVGARAGSPTPRAYMADNDLALGRIVEALSHSAFWKSTVVFVLEDDAQAGPDHVDSHRSVLLAISAYNRGGVSHRFVNTTDVVATIEDILKLGRLSQFDQFGRPLREIWSDTPDLTPYSVLTPATPLRELNPRTGAMAEASKKLVLDVEDRSDDDLFNRILWRSLKGDQPYPGITRMSSLELKRSR